MFCEAYRQVHPNLHNAMRHLFGTWATVFPPSIIRKIEAQLSLLTAQESSSLTSSRASESPRPTHGIHVNPKYLRQLEHSVVDKVSIYLFFYLEYNIGFASVNLNIYHATSLLVQKNSSCILLLAVCDSPPTLSFCECNQPKWMNAFFSFFFLMY